VAHLKKSATTGHLVKNSGGHLVNECGLTPVLLLPCFPIFVLEPCGGGAPICCRNDFREFDFAAEDDGHLWAQDVLIIRGGQCYRIRYCEEDDGCANPGIETDLKVWGGWSYEARIPANHQWQDGDCDYLPGVFWPDCDYCPPKFAVGNHTCGGPGHGACGMNWATENGVEGVGIGYDTAGGFAPYGEDRVFNIGICPIAGPPPGGCNDLLLKITWHDMQLDDWVEPLNRPINEKPPPPDCWYVFDGQIPYDRNVGLHGCILERRVPSSASGVITLDEPANPGDLVPCYEIADVVDNPEAAVAEVKRNLTDCGACCDE